MSEDPTGKVRQILERAPFVMRLGTRLKGCGPGWCETTLPIQDWHAQQDGFVHAGVLATLADQTAGAALGTELGATQGVLSIEFKINLLRPALGPELRCKGVVLKRGKTIGVTEAEVFFTRDGQEKLAAKATVTLAIVERGATVG